MSFGTGTPGVFVLSAIIARKNHCIWSGSYSVVYGDVGAILIVFSEEKMDVGKTQRS